MRLFYTPGSPYARIVRVALLETGLDARVSQQTVTLRDPGSALLPFNATGRVPTLELDDGTILTESTLMLHYIDSQHNGRPLLPRDGSDGWRTLAEMGIAAGMMEGIVAWGRELRRPVNERSPGLVTLELLVQIVLSNKRQNRDTPTQTFVDGLRREHSVNIMITVPGQPNHFQVVEFDRGGGGALYFLNCRQQHYGHERAHVRLECQRHFLVFYVELQVFEGL